MIVAVAAALAYADGAIEINGETHDLTTASQIGVIGTGAGTGGSCGGSGSGSGSGGGTDCGELTRAEILSASPPGAFRLYEISGHDQCDTLLECTYSNRPLSTFEQIIGVACEHSGMGSASARLRVYGSNPLVDFDEETISCFSGPTTDAAFAVLPETIDVGAVPVGTTSMPARLITVKNLLTVDYPLSISTFSTEWSVTGCGSPCTLHASEELQLMVTLLPQSAGPRDSMVLFSGGANGTLSAATVTLRGTGVDSVESLDVTSPMAPFELDMGPVPLSGGMRTMNLSYSGNNPSAAVSIMSSDFDKVRVNRDAFTTVPGDNPVVVTCIAPTPGEVSETLTITSSPLIQQNTMTVTVTCSVTNVSVTLEPAELAFGDVLKGSPFVDLVLMVRNTGAAMVALGDFEIAATPPVTTLMVVAEPTGPVVPGGVAEVTVRMTPSVGEDYGDTTRLTFTVDGTVLDVPITGRVTERSGHIEPTGALDLGTACVGAPITGTIRLVNDGTAPIQMAAPVIMGPFFATYSPVVMFPTQLPEGEAQSVFVTSTQTSGSLEGNFFWEVDVGPYSLDLRAEYIADGTAVSPRALDFATIDVDATTALRTVTLENCDTAPAQLMVQGVVSRQGPARAWIIEPAMETTTLDPGERYMFTVRFAPATPGQHIAELPILVDGVQTTVMLSGFADGELIERTSFYACTCNGGSLAAGWPLLLALLPLRRRRVSAVRARSARSRSRASQRPVPLRIFFSSPKN